MIPYTKSIALEKADPFLRAYKGNVRIEEKVDGSNVSVHFRGQNNMVLQSRTTVLDPENPGMFQKFVHWAHENREILWTALLTSYVFYGEMPGNGKLRYPDAPRVLGFDVLAKEYDWMNETTIKAVSGPETQIPYDFLRGSGIEFIKPLYEGPYQGIDHAKGFLGKSAYADIQMEGVVVKAPNVTCWYTNAAGEEVKYTDSLLVGKIVTEQFKETKTPKTNPSSVIDPTTWIAEAVVTPARVQKAKQRAEEEGTFDPKKPHTLIPYVAKDVHDEDEEFVKDLLFKAYWKGINKKIAARVVELS